MKHKIYSVLLSVFFCTNVMSQNLMIADFEGNGTDRMIPERFGTVGSGNPFEVVDNPYKTGNNTSDKVMKISDVVMSGGLHLNLTRNITGEADKITACREYDGIRLKYRVNNPAQFSALNATINPNGMSDYAVNAVWTNTDADWKTATFTFATLPNSVANIQIQLYRAVWTNAGTPIAGLEIYFDDVELFKVPPQKQLMVANFEGDGTDRMTTIALDGRIGLLGSNNSAYEIIDNPYSTGNNLSAKVLKIYDVTNAASFHLNLTRNITQETDKISNGVEFNGIRLKYRVNNPASFPSRNAGFIVNANANYNFTGIWTDTSEDWQTITARFDSIPAGTMQCVQFQLYKESWNPVAGLEIYIDDIELIKNAGTNQSEVLNMIKVNDADIEFFEQDTLNYVYNLPYTHDPANIPTVDYTPGIDGQNVTLTPAVNLSGSEAERTASLSIMQDQAVVTQYKILFNILPPLDIYICLGQSNMSGYGEITETDKGVIANTYLLTPSEKFEAATNPLNRYSTISNGTYARISPAYGFAQALAGKTENPLGLLVNARNGSSIADWGKANANNTNLYANTLNRAIAARDWGIIKGIIWHQGESDSWQASAYMNLLKTWVNNFRNDMGDTNSEIYFVAGELAYWRQNGTGSTDFNNVIHDIASNIPNSDWVSAAGLTPYLDETDPHFSRESAITLGERYAEKIIGKFYGTPTALDDISANDISISAYTLTGRLLTILDANVSRICIYDIYGRNILTQSLQKQTTCTLPAQGWYILSQEYQDKKQICKIYIR